MQIQKVYSTFKGETMEMSGNVFQCHSEQRERGQFEETIGALTTFSSTKYVSNIDYLTPIFVNLSQPVLTKPNLTSKNKTSTFEGGVTRIVTTLSQEEIEEYNIKLKELLKDEKA